MSDTPNGPDWWLASDGKWYPGHLAHGAPPSQIPGPQPGPHSGAAPHTPVPPKPAPAHKNPWRRFRSWPRSIQAGSWVVAFFVVVGIIGAATGAGKKSNTNLAATSQPTTAATTAPSKTTMPATTVAPTTVAPPTTAPPTTPPTTTPPTTPPTTAPPTTPAPTTPSLTLSQQNAIESAQQYMSMGNGFSRLGLIQQLSSAAGDGYSLADATYAVDSLHEDWNAQAVLSAKNYLSMEPFSCSGLVQQLSSAAGDQFTVAQAQYGAKEAGIC